MKSVLEAAQEIVKDHVAFDSDMTGAWLVHSDEEIRLIETTGGLALSPDHEEVLPFRFGADPEEDDHNYATVLIMLPTGSIDKIKDGTLALPAGWDKDTMQQLYNGTDPRKLGLKNGLRQLNTRQLQRVIDYPGEMVLDDCNYEDGKFCPLAVALGLDKTMSNPSHDKVFQSLTDLGYEVYNTRGIEGEFYTTNRKRDLLEAANEVLREKQSIER